MIIILVNLDFASVMKKVVYLLVVLLFFGCNETSKKNDVNFSGKLNTIAVIIDDDLWNGEVGDSVRNKFASPVLGLPQEEPLFSLNQYPVKLLEGFKSNSRNVLIIKKVAKSEFTIDESTTSNPQNVIRFSGRTVQELIDSVQVHSLSIIKIIKKSEIERYQRILRLLPKADTKEISKKLSIKLSLPAKYKMMLKGSNFFWYKKEITSGNLSVLVYQLPFNSIKDNPEAVNRIIKIRDSIGNKYIHGAVPRTRMITEKSFAPFISKTSIYGKPTFETKGNWELSNDFMSGPFLNYAIMDQTNHRVLIVEGFCYAPAKQKRDLLFELEAIAKSILFLKK